MAENIEIIEEIKTKLENPIGMAEVFGDRIIIKSKDPKFKDFAPVVMSKTFLMDYERIKPFKVYEDDIWLIGYPRSGTTLMQEMLWLIMNDYNFEAAKSADTYNRAQWFDFFCLLHKIQGVPVDHLDKMPRPRIFKTHSPVQFLPDQVFTVKPKIVHIVRDIKDVAISLYHLRKNSFHDDVGTMEEHFEEILSDRTWWCGYREHVLNYKNLPDYPHILYVTYEELVGDMAATIRKTVNFVGKTITDEQMTALLDHLKFDKMKKNKNTNMQKYHEIFNQLSNEERDTTNFIRKGIVGDHKNQMSPEMIKRFDEWMAKSSELKPGFNK